MAEERNWWDEWLEKWFGGGGGGSAWYRPTEWFYIGDRPRVPATAKELTYNDFLMLSPEEQERRFRKRIEDRTRRWKFSPVDLYSRTRWVEYSKAKDQMFAATDIKQAPWYVVDADDKRRARINCISHLLSMIPYEDLPLDPIELPPRQTNIGYVRPPLSDYEFVPDAE